MPKILAIDQGTTSTRAIVFSETWDILHIAQKELGLIYPNSGWVEQNPEDILADTLSCIDDCIRHHPDIAAMGITNQRETTILWDKETGKPLYNAIVWQDRRTADFCRELQPYSETISSKTGLLLDPYFSGTKIRWILDNCDEVGNDAENGKILFGTVETFLLWHLTQGKTHATDVSNASRTMLMNINSLEWDDELLQLFNIPKAILPCIHENCDDFGFYRGIPITAMAGDQQAALIGQSCLEKGMIKATYGTGCFALMNIGDQPKLSKNKLLTSVGYVVQGKKNYILEGSIFVSGAALQWLRDEMHFFKFTDEIEKLALSVTNSDGVIFIPAFTGLGAPYWNPDVRGAIFGLSRGTTQAHIMRAALEAQAFQTKDLMRSMILDTGINISLFRIDGGLAKNGFVGQFLADILNVQVDIPKSVETTALGIAYLSAIGKGILSGLHDIPKLWKKNASYEASMSDKDRNSMYAVWTSHIQRLISP